MTIAPLPSKFLLATVSIAKNNQLLATALGVPVCPVLPVKKSLSFGKQSGQSQPSLNHAIAGTQAVLAWGQKPSAKQAQKLANQRNLPLWTAEDGFLRSLDSGIKSRYGASFVLDDVGIYFDLRAPSRLEWLLVNRAADFDDDKQQRAKYLIHKIIAHKLSKYNPSLTLATNLPTDLHLVIDQVAGDASIAGAGASDKNFFAMLLNASQSAMANGGQVCIKAHPASNFGFLVNSTGKLHTQAIHYLSSHGISQDAIDCILIIKQVVNPIALLENAKAIYTVSSHLGFEALMLGKSVASFGMSWYAGLGLTDDTYLQDNPAMRDLYQQVKARRAALGLTTVTLEQAFFAAYIDYSYYADPATAKACQIETVIDYLIRNRDQQSFVADDVLAYDFSRWKTGFVKGFSQFPQTQLKFKSKTKMRLFFTDQYNAKRAKKDDQKALSGLPVDTKYLVWGLAAKHKLANKIHTYQNQSNPAIICMEDGFIRSNGLGATLLEPLSVVMDDVGIYYDATAPSRLEMILQSIDLTDEQVKRAAALQQTLLANQVSKYNVGTHNDQLGAQIAKLKQANPSAIIHLVVGQVEDDASVQNCTSIIKTNADLLKRARADHPNDIIIYKPHPDIEAGLRLGKVDDQTLKLADIIAHDTAMPQCLAVVNVVQTISSLTGFEALLRGVSVVCYGLPFYAGFGLTTDIIEPDNAPKLAAIARRQRQTPLSLSALIHGTLIDYPVYRLPHGHGLASVEQVIDYLYQSTHAKPTPTLAKRISRFAKTKFMQLRKFTI